MKTQPEPVTYLSPAQWEELQALIDEDRPPNTTLLAAAQGYSNAIELGDLVVLSETQEKL